jgi:DNA-binding LacI/PurR family transcriptional regulator
VGRIVTETLLDRIESKGQEYFRRDITLDVKLLVRESTLS